MTRYSTQEAYGQSIEKIGQDWYRLSWKIDRYRASSRLRFPTTYTRDTDEKGAKKFAQKHEIDLPTE